MKTQNFFNSLIAAVFLNIGYVPVFAQSDEQKLTSTILHLDSAFWNAYNNCDTTHFKDFLTEDVEFYHDKGGVTTDARSLITALNRNICGNTNSRLRREAVAGTVKVYPMQNGNETYGAIILGEHNFYVTEKGKQEYQSGIANFTQLWILKNAVWKMSRILSFNHHPPGYTNTRKEIDLPAKQFDEISGNYKSARSGIMTVSRDNQRIMLKGGDHVYILYPQAANSFFSKDRDLVFEFVKDATGKPLKMIVKENGATADELVFQK